MGVVSLRPFSITAFKLLRVFPLNLSFSNTLYFNWSSMQAVSPK